MEQNLSSEPTVQFISLGWSCQVAHQIRRFHNSDTAFFFDWLITEDNAYKSLFIDPNELFQPGNWSLVDGEHGRLRLLDHATNLKFQHEFPTVNKDESDIDEAQVDQHLDVAKSKFIHLMKKTIETIKCSDSVCLIRHDLNADQFRAKAIAEDILKIYEKLNSKVKVLVVSPLITCDITTEKFYIRHVEKSEIWSGNDLSWNEIFLSISSDPTRL